jgi:hypothetical protein
MKHKMVTLSPDTHKIASKMDNFSGWIRARLRQFDEGVDLVGLEISKDYIKLQLKNLTTIINSLPHPQVIEDIWEQWNELMKQKKLEDFQ